MTILSERRQLINLAYRMLGSLTEAEDAVQETYARWYALGAQEREDVRSPGAWLTKVASRVCLDLLGSARARRERYVGEWIPEPLPGPDGWGATADPADRVTLDESVSMAFLVVLESMTPAERVVFVLHEVFRYPFAEVADIVGRSPAACRQLASSARRRIEASRRIDATSKAVLPAIDRARIVRDFKRAWEAKDIDALIGVLDPDAIAIADGGGLASTVLRPIEGAARIARYALEISGRVPGMKIFECTVNGQPGLVAQHGGLVVTVVAFGIADDRIQQIWAVRNPDKLRSWQVR